MIGLTGHLEHCSRFTQGLQIHLYCSTSSASEFVKAETMTVAPEGILGWRDTVNFGTSTARGPLVYRQEPLQIDETISGGF